MDGVSLPTLHAHMRGGEWDYPNEAMMAWNALMNSWPLVDSQ